MKDKVLYFENSIFPVQFGYCPSPKAYKAELERLGFTNTDWPDFPACTTTMRYDGNVACIVTIRDHDIDPMRIAAGLAHEATHIWQAIVEKMHEKNPSDEFMAYTIEYITLKLLRAYVAFHL